MKRVLKEKSSEACFDCLRCIMMCICGLFFAFIGLVVVGSGDVYALCSIGLSADGEVVLNMGADTTSVVTDTVNVNTNCANGYSLYISGPNDTTLYKDGDKTSGDYITTVSGTNDLPAALGVDTYGYSVLPGTTEASGSFIGLAGVRAPLAVTDSPSAVGGDDIVVYYGVKVANDRTAGSYMMANNGGITYYVVANGITFVSFDANGGTIPAGANWDGSGSTAIKEAVNGVYGDLPEPTREGYTFMGWSSNRLPDGYHELEYVRFNTGSFIDTGIIPTNHTTKIKFDYETYTSDEYLLGTSQGSGYYYTSSYENKYAFGHDGKKSWTSYGTWTTGDHILVYNGEDNEIVLDGDLLESGFGIASTTTLWIGKRGSTANYAGKIYYAKITDKTTGELVRDFVPCYREQDNVVGLCDKVEGVFYANDGTSLIDKGSEVTYMTAPSPLYTSNNHTLYAAWSKKPIITFDANGGVVDISSKTVDYDANYGELPVPEKDGYSFVGWSTNNMPTGYQEADYVSLTGTQYIDTNYALWKNQNWKMELKFDVSQFYNYNNMFGSLDVENTSNEIWIDNGRGYYIRIGGISKTKIASLELDTAYTMVHDNTGKRLLNYVNGGLVSSLSRANTSFNSTLGFGHRVGSMYLKGKIYYLKFWSDGALVRYMVPCYEKPNGAIGLCDAANGVFYPNAGTGDFGKGVDVDSFVTENTQVVSNSDHTLYAVWEDV